MITVACPQCHREINFDSTPDIGQQITCLSCNTDLIVIWLFPISLDYPENPLRNSAESEKNAGK